MVRHLSLLLVPLPGTVKYSQRMKSQTEHQGNREGKNIIRKTISLSLFSSLSLLVSLSVFLSLSPSLAHYLITLKSNCITLHFTGHLVPPGLPVLLAKGENG